MFLLVADGLSGLIGKPVELGLLSGFKIGASDLVVSHLQYVDYTLILAYLYVKNIWSIKVILRGSN